MTNDEINAAISAWFEPKPAPLDWVIIDQPIPSAKGFWLHTNSGYERGDVSVTIPLDYFHSEDANARLLEAGKFSVFYWDGGWWCARPVGTSFTQGLPIESFIKDAMFSADRKTAVVMAFLKFAGIAHKRDGGEGA